MEQQIEVKVYEKEDYEKVLTFLQNVTSLNSIEDELFDNAVLIVEEEEVLGMISYELFRGKALIRYFIFDKDVDECYLVDMYQLFFTKLKERDIHRVFVIVNSDVIKQMFNDLGFSPFDKEDFYLTEENILNTKYKDASVLYYDV